MLTWIHADPKYMAGKHLEGQDYMSSVNQPRLGAVYFIKGSQGYPGDVHLYDANYIYLWITELTRQAPPTSYKATYHKTTIPLCKRFSKDGDYVLSTNSTIGVYQGCNLTSTFILGDVKCQMHDAGVQDVGGSIGKIHCLQVAYYWGGNGHATGIYNNRELYTYAYPYGVVNWAHAVWNGSGWKPVQSVLFSTVKPGAPAPNFPQCHV